MVVVIHDRCSEEANFEIINPLPDTIQRGAVIGERQIGFVV